MMQPISAVPFDSDIAEYEDQAEALLAGWREGDKDAIATARRHHPKFLDTRISWLQKPMSDEEVRATPFDIDDARLAVARWYEFRDWPALATHVDAVTARGSPVQAFEAAAEAIVSGDVGTLAEELRNRPGLIRARSQRITSRDPKVPVHGATLLHYIAANGVEGYRQKSPSNAVEVARTLLDAGAEVDAFADMYGGKATTMSTLVSSTPPHQAGTQVPLAETLLDYGAAIEGKGAGNWVSPLLTALAFGFTDTARALVRRGAHVDTLPAAAGLGLVERVRDMLPAATPVERHRAMALAAQHGHADVVAVLLEAGEDPSRYNPEGNHSHSTPLHQAVWSGHEDVVRLLVEGGARLDIKDTIYQGTPLGWARHGGRTEIADYLRAQGG
jgi:ankyrin repeat protein